MGMTGMVILFPNEFCLPFKFHIIFLPFDGISFKWFLSYCCQVLTTFFAATFFIGYFCMTMLLMNHSCWLVDSAIQSVLVLAEAFLHEKIDANIVRREMKTVIDASLEIFSWMNGARKILRFSFLTEFALLSSILCMSILSFISNPKESVNFMIIATFAMMQFTVYCWMGSRFKTRVKDLSFAIYNSRWDKLSPRQQKDLQLVLSMTQNINGFDAVFKPLDLGSLQSVGTRSVFILKFS